MAASATDGDKFILFDQKTFDIKVYKLPRLPYLSSHDESEQENKPGHQSTKVIFIKQELENYILDRSAATV